jgi:FKBP-type peptidyl-prolyl cis-trans isomerase SlyD
MDELPPGGAVEVGGTLTGQDEDGAEVTFTTTVIEGGIVSLDGNHLFAGQSLMFEVEIQGIRDATGEELRQRKGLVKIFYLATRKRLPW